ncbi:recombinase family protein [Mesorhizobium sp.]|uniref:recombinase family protein n=1 Tax=Mesorhizobium sp. TaxID=1871066 RepID=UPI0025D497FE|nr:recombinase family protein [Mesorhizobium sp.]
MLPHGCKDFYETLRAAVLCGQACVKDTGAIVFHRFWQGLAVLIAAPQPSPPMHRRPEPPPTASAAVHDRQLVHMLANMCWQQRSEAIMSTDIAMKVDADHLRRDAFLYVRQSSLRQVFENTESTKRQYALRDRAVALGWPIERVHVIDSDLGLSGAQSQDRDGFQHLVTEVAMGYAGIVLGLEVSPSTQQCRLAPSP